MIIKLYEKIFYTSYQPYPNKKALTPQVNAIVFKIIPILFNVFGIHHCSRSEGFSMFLDMLIPHFI